MGRKRSARAAHTEWIHLRGLYRAVNLRSFAENQRKHSTHVHRFFIFRQLDSDIG
jgi:hypothetical protein